MPQHPSCVAYLALAASLAWPSQLAAQFPLRVEARADTLIQLRVDGQSRAVVAGTQLVLPGPFAWWGLNLGIGDVRCSRAANLAIASELFVDPALETLIIDMGASVGSGGPYCGSFSASSGPQIVQLQLTSTQTTLGFLRIDGEVSDSRSSIAVDTDNNGSFDLIGPSISELLPRQLQADVPWTLRVRTSAALTSQGRDATSCRLKISLRHGVPMQRYGSGCTPSGTDGPFRTFGWAHAGELRFENEANIATGIPPVLVLGTQRTDTPLVGWGCRLLTDVVATYPAPTNRPFRHVRIPYPASASGAQLNAQWLIVTTVTPGIVSSNGVGVVLP